MSKYEIIVLVSSKLTVDQADKVLTDLNKNIKVSNIDSKFLGTWELAYPINNETLAHYYQINFDGEGNSFVDWKRLILINKSVLRHLIINLSKDYGARASKNEKKLKISVARKTKYDEIMNNPDYVHTKPGPQIIVKKKRKDEWTLVRRIGANGPEDITIKSSKSKKSKFADLPEYKIPSKKQTQQQTEAKVEQEILTPILNKEVETQKPIIENVQKEEVVKVEKHNETISKVVNDKKIETKETIAEKLTTEKTKEKKPRITKTTVHKEEVAKKTQPKSKTKETVKHSKVKAEATQKDSSKKVVLKPVSTKKTTTSITTVIKKKVVENKKTPSTKATVKKETPKKTVVKKTTTTKK